MFRNYFYLIRCVHDLSYIIKNESIRDIYTQEKDKLFISIPKNDNSNFHIVISTQPQNSYITTRTLHRKAKKNTKNFFDNAINNKINSISIAENDRIIKFELTHNNIYFLIRGADTNIISLDNKGNCTTFKKIQQYELQKIVNEIDSINFCYTPDKLLIDLELLSYEKVIKKYRYIDKTIKNELTHRNSFSNSEIIKTINEILNNDIAVFIDENNGLPLFQPSTFFEASRNKSVNLFDNYFDAVNKYHTLKYSGTTDKIIRSEIEKYLNKELERLANKINNLSARVEIGSKEKEYYRNANLLLNNINKIKKGMKKVEIYDSNYGSNVSIEIDEKLSPAKNIDKMFDKAKSERLNFDKSKELLLKSKHDYKRLQELRTKLEASNSVDELVLLKKDLKIKSNMGKSEIDEKINFKHYLIEEKYHVFVGKDSKNNDLLTTRFAKQNDLWFHARGVSGSHVVLRIDNPKEAVPKNIIKKAASLAAFHSKAKTSKLAPVAYTFKKYVVKKKDLNPGQVYLLREEVIMVPPEIPNDCKMIDYE